jgi:RNA polymerase sigma-70 factor (ECF subfamily)
VQRLPDKLRTTIILYYYQDLDINDTAFSLKVPPGTVKSRLSKAKKLLKEMLNDEVEL